MLPVSNVNVIRYREKRKTKSFCSKENASGLPAIVAFGA
jgi:hypothetical protein